MVFTPVEGVSLADWARTASASLTSELVKAGAILFRGFDLESANDFRAVAEALSPSLAEYPERTAQRTVVQKGVYTSTAYPADQRIHLHHEMSYSHQAPRRIWFYCDGPPETGGSTPLCDDRRVWSALPEDMRAEFSEKKIMYVRNFGLGVDMPWQEAFQTDDKREVERYCDDSRIEVEWMAGGRLRTRQVRDAVAVHPDTHECVWFNHAHMFHWSSLDQATAKALLSQFREDELPRNACFGDGTPIPVQNLQDIRDTYDRLAVRFEWQKGDVLMLDNILTSHGRDPFSGQRRILVAMADFFDCRNGLKVRWAAESDEVTGGE